MLPEDAAKHILDTFVHTLGHGPGDTFSSLELAPYFEAAPWRREECWHGITYATERGWIEKCGIGIGHFILTEAGAQAASPSHLDRSVGWVR